MAYFCKPEWDSLLILIMVLFLFQNKWDPWVKCFHLFLPLCGCEFLTVFLEGGINNWKLIIFYFCFQLSFSCFWLSLFLHQSIKNPWYIKFNIKFVYSRLKRYIDQQIGLTHDLKLLIVVLFHSKKIIADLIDDFNFPIKVLKLKAYQEE